MVDPWEAQNDQYCPTARVLDHVEYEINEVMGGVECVDGTRRPAKIVLLAGFDLIQTMSTPGVWDEKDLDHILGDYGVFALERTGTDIETALANLKQWEKNIHVMRQVRTEIRNVVRGRSPGFAICLRDTTSRSGMNLVEMEIQPWTLNFIFASLEAECLSSPHALRPTSPMVRSSADMMTQVVANDISSTKVRLLLKRDFSIDYL